MKVIQQIFKPIKLKPNYHKSIENYSCFYSQVWKPHFVLAEQCWIEIKSHIFWSWREATGPPPGNFENE